MTLPPCRRCGASICACREITPRAWRVVVEWHDPIRGAWGWSAAIARGPRALERALDDLIAGVGSRDLVRVLVLDLELVTSREAVRDAA